MKYSQVIDMISETERMCPKISGKALHVVETGVLDIHFPAKRSSCINNTVIFI